MRDIMGAPTPELKRIASLLTNAVRLTQAEEVAIYRQKPFAT
jgi:hypothetical protein